MGIKLKIVLGFIILASMLFISGAVSLLEINQLGRSMRGLIDYSHRSVELTKSMLDALEEQDRAILQFMVSGGAAHRHRFDRARGVFQAQLDSVRANPYLEEECRHIDSVWVHHAAYLAAAHQIFGAPGGSLARDLERVHRASDRVSAHVQHLMKLNQAAIVRSAGELERSAQRATLPGLVVILTSLLFTLVFTYFVNHFFVSPIVRLTKGINDFVKFRKPLDVPIETRDELLSLKEAIVNLVSLCHQGRKE